MRCRLPVLIGLFGSTAFALFNVDSGFGQTVNVPNEQLALVGGTIYTTPAAEPIADGVVVTAPNERWQELSAALAREDIHLSGMAAVDTSLEEYFLEVTGEDQ